MEHQTMRLSDEAKQARRAYQRKWRSQNRDKIRAQEQRHWERVARQIAEETANCPQSVPA